MLKIKSVNVKNCVIMYWYRLITQQAHNINEYSPNATSRKINQIDAIFYSINK